jgi:hypothetical protein
MKWRMGPMAKRTGQKPWNSPGRKRARQVGALLRLGIAVVGEPTVKSWERETLIRKLRVSEADTRAIRTKKDRSDGAKFYRRPA